MLIMTETPLRNLPRSVRSGPFREQMHTKDPEVVKNKVLYTRVPTKHHARIKKLAAVQGIEVAQLVRNALREYELRHGYLVPSGGGTE